MSQPHSNSILTSSLYLSQQLEPGVPGNNFEEFPDKRLMSNQQRNIVSSTLRTTFACCKKLLGKFVFQDVISICPAKVLEKN